MYFIYYSSCGKRIAIISSTHHHLSLANKKASKSPVDPYDHTFVGFSYLVETIEHKAIDTFRTSILFNLVYRVFRTGAFAFKYSWSSSYYVFSITLRFYVLYRWEHVKRNLYCAHQHMASTSLMTCFINKMYWNGKLQHKEIIISIQIKCKNLSLYSLILSHHS